MAGIDLMILRSKYNNGPFTAKRQFIEEALRGTLNQYAQRANEGTLDWWKTE
jgi:hypothetical protein